MGNAIRIRVKSAPKEYDLGASKFFGSPTIPGEWIGDFYDDTMFFCQIRLEDLAKYDTENRLPHAGYLYIFLDAEEGDYGLMPIVRYYDGEPDTVVDDFNEEVEGYSKFTKAWLMEFEECDGSEACTRLFGVPSDWNYEDSAPSLLMQFDPLDSEMGFLDHLDGFLYFAFGEDESNFDEITLLEEYS